MKKFVWAIACLYLVISSAILAVAQDNNLVIIYTANTEGIISPCPV